MGFPRTAALHLVPVLGLFACGIPEEAHAPEDPEQRAIEQVLSEPEVPSTAPRTADPGALEVPLWVSDLVARPVDAAEPIEPTSGDETHAAGEGRSPSALHRSCVDHLELAVHGQSDGHDPVSHLADAERLCKQAARELDGPYEHYDALLFDLFAIEFLQGDPQETRLAGLEVIRETPMSERVAYVYLGIAEVVLAEGNPDGAVKLLEKLTELGVPHASAFAWHRAGYAYAAMDPPDHTKALEAFVRTIATTQSTPMPVPETERALRSDARRALVTSYAHVGRPDRALGFFKHVGRGPDGEDDVDAMLEQLQRELAALR